jgi:hypothetical protein
MAKSKPKRKAGLVEAFRKAGARDAHPHLDPLYAASFTAERDIVAAKAGNLLAYRQYLAAARATKAQRKRVPESFERNVLAQARLARADLDAFTVAALRMQQQVNHTGLWRRTHANVTRMLRETGPVNLKSMWAEVAGNAQYRSALAGHGVTADITAAITEAVGTFDAAAVLRGGKVSVETRVAGEATPRWLSLVAGPSRPANISDLLRRSQFDRVTSALTNGERVYLEPVPGAADTGHEFSDLMAFGAVAARQCMAEHVRKLEDTGLATYEGNDPITFIGALLVIGIFLGLVGATILYLCDHPTEVEQPEWLCTVGAVLVVIAAIALAVASLIFFIDGVLIAGIGVIGFTFIFTFLVDAFDRLSRFNPEGVPA